MIVDGKYVKLRGGRRGVLLIALGLTDHGVRAVLAVSRAFTPSATTRVRLYLLHSLTRRSQ